MKISRTFAIQLLAVALFVPSVWFYVHAGPDLFSRQFDLAALLDARRFWLAFTAPFVWIVHALVMILAILRPFVAIGIDVQSNVRNRRPKKALELRRHPAPAANRRASWPPLLSMGR